MLASVLRQPIAAPTPIVPLQQALKLSHVSEGLNACFIFLHKYGRIVFLKLESRKNFPTKSVVRLVYVTSIQLFV